jgi:hypothetical protein
MARRNADQEGRRSSQLACDMLLDPERPRLEGSAESLRRLGNGRRGPLLGGLCICGWLRLPSCILATTDAYRLQETALPGSAIPGRLGAFVGTGVLTVTGQTDSEHGSGTEQKQCSIGYPPLSCGQFGSPLAHRPPFLGVPHCSMFTVSGLVSALPRRLLVFALQFWTRRLGPGRSFRGPSGLPDDRTRRHFAIPGAGSPSAAPVCCALYLRRLR